jgi:hypothetical protein
VSFSVAAAASVSASASVAVHVNVAFTVGIATASKGAYNVTFLWCVYMCVYGGDAGASAVGLP